MLKLRNLSLPLALLVATGVNSETAQPGVTSGLLPYADFGWSDNIDGASRHPVVVLDDAAMLLPDSSRPREGWYGSVGVSYPNAFWTRSNEKLLSVSPFAYVRLTDKGDIEGFSYGLNSDAELLNNEDRKANARVTIAGNQANSSSGDYGAVAATLSGKAKVVGNFSIVGSAGLQALKFSQSFRDTNAINLGIGAEYTSSDMSLHANLSHKWRDAKDPSFEGETFTVGLGMSRRFGEGILSLDYKFDWIEDSAPRPRIAAAQRTSVYRTTIGYSIPMRVSGYTTFVSPYISIERSNSNELVYERDVTSVGVRTSFTF